MRLLLIIMIVIFSGCAVIDGGIEAGKTVWGSSTRALENARVDAIVRTYDKGYWEVIRAAEEFCKDRYVIFKKDEIKGYMVIMGVKGTVNTTEIGVFFIDINDAQTRVEVSSLSTNAKRIVAKQFFHGLDIAFGLVPPDPEDIVPSDALEKDEPK